MSNLATATSTNSLNVKPWVNQLLTDGYCIIPDLLPREKVETLGKDLSDRFDKTPFCTGPFYGGKTKRFGGLLKRSPHAEALVAHELILGITEDILGPHCDRVQLNLTQALQLHPGQEAQFPHRDQDMWRGVPGAAEYLINVMWPITDYTAENGATTVWPGSHRHRMEYETNPDNHICAEMKPGEALLFLGSTLHGAGANMSSEIRSGVIISYSLGWLKPYESQFLVYPPEVARRFSPEVAQLVGYCQHRPNLGNYEGQCPSILLKDDIAEYLSATDELRPDQLAMIDTFETEKQNAA